MPGRAPKGFDDLPNSTMKKASELYYQALKEINEKNELFGKPLDMVNPALLALVNAKIETLGYAAFWLESGAQRKRHQPGISEGGVTTMMYVMANMRIDYAINMFCPYLR